MSLLSARLALLAEPGNRGALQIRKGLEKESLRVTPEGTLAQTPHPVELGSALTHPCITTDYSEALLEFITQPCDSAGSVLDELDRIQRYTYQSIGEDILWCASMPCMLTSDADIPVAKYGTSNPGRMKTVYRLGLGARYGRSMQTIAGIHYNFSVVEEFWELFREREAKSADLQEFKNQRYFDLIRNFRRYFWLLLYFFGASPAVCPSFVKGRQHRLTEFGSDDHTLHLPYATSLRMGDLGYQSEAQSELVVCYNDIDSYIRTLCSAIISPHPAYVREGVRDDNGDYRQLNTGLLQIENEFYSTIRPKCVAHSGETALGALRQRGVEYIEVRCVDLNPYEPLGISAEQIDFMDVFLVYCLLADSPQNSQDLYHRSMENQRRVVSRGRDPAMRLLSPCGELSLPKWGGLLLDDIALVAAFMDESFATGRYSAVLQAQRDKLADADMTPSARILADMRAGGETFFRFALNRSLQHADNYRRQPLEAAIEQVFRRMASESLQQQRELELRPQIDFEQYLAGYYAQYECSGAPG